MFLSIHSCVRYSNISSRHDLLVDFKTNNSNIELPDLVIRKGNIFQKSEYYNLVFESAVGGGESLLGYSYKNVHADSYKGRFSIACSDENKIKFSVEEILLWPITVINNDTILIAPKICK